MFSTLVSLLNDASLFAFSPCPENPSKSSARIASQLFRKYQATGEVPGSSACKKFESICVSAKARFFQREVLAKHSYEIWGHARLFSQNKASPFQYNKG